MIDHTSTQRDPDPGGFFVGYMRIPAGHRRFLAIALPLTIALMGVGAAGLSLTQPAWGDGSWDYSDVREFSGTITASPYPALHVEPPDPDSANASGTTYLLIGELKAGVSEALVSALPDAGTRAGARVTLEASVVERDGRALLSLTPAQQQAVIEALEGRDAAATSSSAPGVRVAFTGGPTSLTLTGEIVDSKCYFGAMKPGEGRGHKSCAQLCLEGRIPPVFVSTAADGSLAYHLLLSPDGDAFNDAELDALLPYVADLVEITAAPRVFGSWNALALDPAAIARR